MGLVKFEDSDSYKGLFRMYNLDAEASGSNHTLSVEGPWKNM
jgi:hypothetical protein